MTYPYSGPAWGQQQGQWGQPAPVQRPGTLTAASVIAFVAAGIEIIGGFVWMAGGALIDSAEDTVEDIGVQTDGVGNMIIALALVSLALGGCYIWGGIAALGGKNTKVLFVVTLLVALINLIALIAAGPAGAVGLTLAVVLVGLLLAPPTRSFVRFNGGKTF